MKRNKEMKVEQGLKYYSELPYTIQLIKNDDGTYFASIKELPGCLTEGDTQQEALEMLDDAKLGWLEIALEDSDEIPLPENLIKKAYSGKFNIRMPKSLHRRLSEGAGIEGVSLNTHAVALLGSGNALKQHLEEVEQLNRYLVVENTKLKNEVSSLRLIQRKLRLLKRQIRN